MNIIDDRSYFEKDSKLWLDAGLAKETAYMLHFSYCPTDEDRRREELSCIGRTSEERSQGFQEVMQDYPNCQIVYSACGDFTYEGGKQVVEDYMASHKWDIDVIFSQNDDMALGAAEALEAHGLKPGVDVKLISVDGAR